MTMSSKLLITCSLIITFSINYFINSSVSLRRDHGSQEICGSGIVLVNIRNGEENALNVKGMFFVLITNVLFSRGKCVFS